MEIQIYNSLRRRKEPLRTLEPGRVSLYVCGVTPYDRAHLGHAMSAIVFDVVRRHLSFRGYEVQHVVNFTDVDDKIIRRARSLGVEPEALARRYADEFLEELARLQVLPAGCYPRVTETIAAIIRFIEALLAGGYAYQAGGDVYFHVPASQGYGALSGRSLENLLGGEGGRVEGAQIAQKRHPADFALWKGAQPGEPAWESPFGKGRPGWHIECSAMSREHLGPQIDIHGGGSDLLFPHHENEIAQSKALAQVEGAETPFPEATGSFARFWMHNGMLRVLTPCLQGQEDMSKSRGNGVAIRDFLERYSADTLRLLVLGSHYRKPLLYSVELAEESERRRERLLCALRARAKGRGEPEAGARLQAETQKLRRRFLSAMDDDFNTPRALASLFSFTREIHTARDAGASESALQGAQATLQGLSGILGLSLKETPTAPEKAAPFIEILVGLRAELRGKGLFPIADKIRRQLADQGITLEDTPEGTRWRA